MRKKIIFVAIAVVVGAIALYVGVNSIDANPPDVSSFTTTSEIPADEDNAWCGFVAATNAVKRWVSPSDCEKLSLDEIDAILEENAEAIAIFQNMARRTKWYDASARREGCYCFFPVTDFMKIAKLYKAKAERQIVRGEIAAAVEVVGDLLMLSRTIQSDAESIVCWLVAGGTRDFALSIAAQIVASGKAPDEELRRMLAALLVGDSETLRRCARQTVNNEFVYVFGTAQHIIDTDVHEFVDAFGDPQGVLNSDMRYGWTSGPTSRFAYHPNRTKKFYVKIAARAKELLSCDYDKDAWVSFDRESKSALPRLFGRFIPNHVGWYLFVRVFPAYNELVMDLSLGEFGVSASKVVVAAELYRRKTRRRPESLDALVPEFLPSVPTDPFGLGAALKYDAERGVVWTVGRNRNFNGERSVVLSVGANGEIQSGKKSYGKNRKYIINLDGSKVE